jgi:uncharacterized protein
MIHESIGNYRELEFAYDKLSLEEGFELTDFMGKVRINRTPQGLLLDVNFQAYAVGQCVRCLEDYRQLLTTEFQELFAYRSRHTRDEELFVPEDGNIDLEPLTYENFLLVVPIKALCREDCKGLCPICGTNLNETTCEHTEAQIKY